MEVGGEPRVRRYRSEREIEELVERFESCVVAPAEFDHGAHLAVALWYLSRLPYAEAAGRMRAALRRYTAHHNARSHYNETLTIFWLKLVRRFLVQIVDGDERPLAERADELLSTYGSSKLVFEYYSRALVETPEAKATWREPDLKPLDF
jgi:hypothetical protein